jgi:hypothetical protein
VGSFDHRVIPQLRSLEQAGISVDRQVAAPTAIETTARPVTAEIEDVQPTDDAAQIGEVRPEDLPASTDRVGAATETISVNDRRALSRSLG